MKVDMMNAPTRQEALESIISRWDIRREVEYVPLEESIGRVCAREICSKNMMPPYRVSSFDGYAVKSENFENGLPDISKWVKRVDYVNADTGDDFPDEYDTVIAVEDMYPDENGNMRFADGFEFVKGDAIRKAGSHLKVGDKLIDADRKITVELAVVLAMGGIKMVPVYRTLTAAFIPTGNELIPMGSFPQRGTTQDTNSFMIKNLLKNQGIEVFCNAIVKDKYEDLEAAVLYWVEKADIVIINGGTSVGSEDFNAEILEKHSSFFTHGVKAVPGRPVGVSIISGKPVLNVPGPAMAAWLACDWLLKGLSAYYYKTTVPERQKLKVVIKGDIKKKPLFEMITRVIVKRNKEGFTAETVSRKAPVSDVFGTANALLVVPIGSSGYNDGDEVEVELLCTLDQIK